MLLCANSSAMLSVHTFAYHHQISGKSYYLFLQRDTIWGGLAVKRKLSTLAFIKQASHCGHPKYMLGNFTKRSWCRSVWTLFWHCKHFQSTFEQQLLLTIYNPFKLHVTSLQIVSEKHTIYHAKQGTIEIFILLK